MRLASPSPAWDRIGGSFRERTMHNDRIGVLLPSRFRPEGLRRAVDSWEAHSIASDVIFGFQQDDPRLAENLAIAAGRPHRLFDNIGLAAKANALCEALPGYTGYMILNDDQVIHTPRWDRLVLDAIDGWERERGHRLVIPHWRDGIHDRKLPQGFVTAELLEATRTYYPRGYMRHLFTDNYFLMLGRQCGLLRYLPEVFIEHLHVANGKAPMDASYAETQTSAAYARDKAAFDRWMAEAAFDTTERIRLATERAIASRGERS